MSELEAALAALHARDDQTRVLLEQLVRVNSYSTNVAGVNAVGGMLRDALRALPLVAETREDALGIAHHTFRSDASGAPFLLIGHHDTVFPPGELRARGARRSRARASCLDMKGGLAIIVQVLSALHDVGAMACARCAS